MSAQGQKCRIGCTQLDDRHSSQAWGDGPLRKPSTGPPEYLTEAKSQQGCYLLFQSRLLQVPRFSHQILPVPSVQGKTIKSFKHEHINLLQFFLGDEKHGVKNLIFTLEAPIAPAYHQFIFLLLSTILVLFLIVLL